MQNWYCLVHFPDGTQGIHLVPGPAPLQTPGQTKPLTIQLVGKPGRWLVGEGIATQRDDYAAQIWVEPVASDDELLP
jgi:hypothetical protein